MPDFPTTALPRLIVLRDTLVPLVAPVVANSTAPWMCVLQPLDGSTLDGSTVTAHNRRIGLGVWLARELAQSITPSHWPGLEVFLKGEFLGSQGIPSDEVARECKNPYLYLTLGNMPPLDQVPVAVCFDSGMDPSGLADLFREHVLTGGCVVLYGEFAPFAPPVKDPRPDFIRGHQRAWRGILTQVGGVTEQPLLEMPQNYRAAVAVFRKV